MATEGAGMLAPCTCKAECGCSDKIPALPKCDNSVVPKNPDCTAHKNIFCKLDYHGLKNTRCIYCGVDMTACYKVCERTLSEADIKVIVDTHNELRRKVAKGLETRGVGGGQPKAADMFELAWDPVLADSAQRWADQCPEHQPHPHDENRLIPGFSDVGQNIGTTWSRVNSPVRDLATKIEAWYEEVVGWPAANLLRFDRTGIEKEIRHYTQLIWGATTKLVAGTSPTSISKTPTQNTYRLSSATTPQVVTCWHRRSTLQLPECQDPVAPWGPTTGCVDGASGQDS